MAQPASTMASNMATHMALHRASTMASQFLMGAQQGPPAHALRGSAAPGAAERDAGPPPGVPGNRGGPAAQAGGVAAGLGRRGSQPGGVAAASGGSAAQPEGVAAGLGRPAGNGSMHAAEPRAPAAAPSGARAGGLRRPATQPGEVAAAPRRRRAAPGKGTPVGPLALVLLAGLCIVLSPVASSAVHVSRGKTSLRMERGGEGVQQGGVGQLRRELLAQTNPCAALDAKLKKAPKVASKSLAFVRPSDVGPCARTRVSLKPSAAQDLDSLIQYFQNFYSLLNLAKKSPDPLLPSSYDIVAALQAIKAKNFTFEEDFYQALVAAVDGLNDGHTALSYDSTVPSLFRLALNLVGVVENGKPVVRVAPAALTGTAYPSVAGLPPFKFNAAAYYNARVLKVSGQPAWAFLSGWARTQPGEYHSVGQRVNDAFAHLTAVSFRVSFDPGRFSSRLANPGEDFVTMVVQRPGSTKQESIRVPWLAAVDTSAGPFAPRRSTREVQTPPKQEAHLNRHDSRGRALVDSSTQQWPPQMGSSTGSRSGSSTGSDSLRLHLQRALLGLALSQGQGQEEGQEEGRGLGQGQGQAARLDVRRPHFMRKRPRVPPRFQLDQPSLPLRGPTRLGAGAAGGGVISSLTDDMWLVYKLSDGKTGVLVISTFDVEDQSGNPAAFTFINETRKAFATLIKHGCTRIIIDLSGNPGGYVQFGTWFITLLLGTGAVSQPGRLYGFDVWRLLSQTTLVDALVKDRSGAFDGTQYADPATGRGFTTATSTQFFFPTQALAFVKGVTGVYSKAFRSQQTSLEDALGVPSVGPGLGARKIVLLSDGLCFSTCNTVASTLHRSFGLPLVTVGGVPGAKLPFAGGGGGFVTGDAQSDIVNQFPTAVAARKDAPKKFKGRVSLAMRLAAGLFGPKAATPIEFTALKPDFQVSYTAANVANPVLIYEAAAKASFK